MRISKFAAIAALTTLAVPALAEVTEITPEVKSTFVALQADQTYAHVKGGFARNTLSMDVLVTGGEGPFPAIVFVTGNGWRSIDRKILIPQLAALAKTGYVVATIDYRILGEATFPGPEQDVKTAIRYLRANAGLYNVDPEHIGLWGNSAGGHLVSMTGTTGGLAEFDSEEWGDQPSDVQAVVAWYAPLYLGTWGEGPYDAASLHMGFNLFDEANAADAEKGNPATYLDANDPPFLLVHGTDDKLVPFEQSVRFHDDLTAAGVEATLIQVNGVGHSFGSMSSIPEVMSAVQAFFDKHLKGM